MEQLNYDLLKAEIADLQKKYHYLALGNKMY